MGTIEITNRRATLQPFHLNLGGSSKVEDKTQAGEHGDGLKVALITMTRCPQNYRIRCQSGGFSWNFNFTKKGNMVARLTRMTSRKIKEVRRHAAEQVSNSLLPLAADPKRDVQFVIGERSRRRDEKGKRRDCAQVSREDFDKWTMAALFLHDIPAGNLVVSKKDEIQIGHLVLDPRFRGNIYLKGLLLQESTPDQSASMSGKELKFGYNFVSGQTNRDRQVMSSAREESRAMLHIWQGIPNAHNLIEELNSMLNSPDIEYADVTAAKNYMNLETARRLKAYLFSEKFNGKWYYCSEEKAQVSITLPLQAHFTFLES